MAISLLPEYTDRVAALHSARAVLVSGGWIGRPNGPGELAPAIDLALEMVGGEAVILHIPTPGDPGDDPGEEIGYFRKTLRNRRGVWFLDAGADGSWPDYPAMADAVAEANLITIQGGNFAEFLRLAGSPADENSVASLLIAKFLNGDAVFLGSSTGTACWSTAGYSADRDWPNGGGVYPYYRPLPAWGVIPGVFCVHYNERHTQGDATGLFRGAGFQEFLDDEPVWGVGIGIDTQAALVLQGDGTLRVTSRDPYAHVQVLYTGCEYDHGRSDHLRQRILKQSDEPVLLAELFAPVA